MRSILVTFLLIIMLLFGKLFPRYSFMGEAVPDAAVQQEESMGDFTPLDVSDDGQTITYNDENLGSAGD